MITRKASFRLPAIIICFAVVLWMAACAEPEPWKNPCIEEEITTMTEDTDTENTDTEDTATERPSHEYVRQVYDKYRRSLWEYPHVSITYEGEFLDADGNPTGVYGITVGVAELTDQSTLPEEQRIPDCLDGVPVRIIKEGYMIYGLRTEGGQSNDRHN